MSNPNISITDLQHDGRVVATVFDDPQQETVYAINRFTPADTLFVSVSRSDPSKRVIVSLTYDKHRSFNAHKYNQLALISVETQEQRFNTFWTVMKMFHPITYVKVPVDADMRFMQMLAKVLVDPKCQITTLDMCYYKYDREM